MVSNANDDFPEPDKPVITMSLFFGIRKSMFFKLLTRAPWISMFSNLFIVNYDTSKKLHENTKNFWNVLKNVVYLQKI